MRSGLNPATKLRRAIGRSPVRRAVVARRHRGLRPEDVFIASYPRSGNTWLRFLLGDLATGEPVDFEQVEHVAPNVGSHQDAPRVTAGGGRLIKTHEPYRRQYLTAVYLHRDVRDVVVSWYRVTRTEPESAEELDRFVEDFVSSRASPYGSWTDHIRSWRSATDESRIHTVRFAELMEDPAGTLRSVAAFVGLEASDLRIQTAVDRNTAAEMQRREQANIQFLERNFGRRSAGVTDGSSGKWHQILSERHLRQLEPALELNRELGYDGE